MDHYQTLLNLKTVFQSLLNRCKHCSGEPFWCDECEADKAEYFSLMTDLSLPLIPDPYQRFLALIDLML